MTEVQHQCTCGAFFSTADGLDFHLNDYKAQIGFHENRLNECKAHGRAFFVSEADDVASENEPEAKIKFCVEKSCKHFEKPFRKQRELRRHYATHVVFEKKEDGSCACCPKQYVLVSELLSHIPPCNKRRTGGGEIVELRIKCNLGIVTVLETKVKNKLRDAKREYLINRQNLMVLDDFSTTPYSAGVAPTNVPTAGDRGILSHLGGLLPDPVLHGTFNSMGLGITSHNEFDPAITQIANWSI